MAVAPPADAPSAAPLHGTQKVPFPAKTGKHAAIAEPPMPTSDGFMSTEQKLSLADYALALRDEQIEAQVVHYKADLETNAELDAITAQVASEIQSLQAAARAAGPSIKPTGADPREIERELISNLTDMLGRIFKPGKLATHVVRKLGEVAKRFARLFFESELADRIRGTKGTKDEAKAMRFADQALYHALNRAEEHVFAALDTLKYTQPEVKTRAKEDFAELLKGMRNSFLTRSTPELNVLVKYLNEVLSNFFMNELPQMLGTLATEVVRDARLAEANTIAGYKISSSAFPKFRQAFERRFLQRLVPFTEEEMLKRVRESSGEFRRETIRLVATPAIFSEVCEVICDAVYDMLYNDGFLDLPSNWRKRLAASRS